MLKEYRMFGPPGTGKTTRLAKITVPKAVDKYGVDGVVVTSFTRAAAQEIAGRGILIDDQCIGTLHSLCYRALGFPKLVAQGSYINEWNKQNPNWKLVGAKISSLDDSVFGNDGDYDGDKLLADLNIARSKVIPEEKWFGHIKKFSQKWTLFKNSYGIMDFTDLISEVIERDIPPPGNAKVMLVDEAQDLTPIQLKLCRKWGEKMDWIMLVGDDDQTIYSFTGATPDAFLTPEIPDAQKKVLNQSYRVPENIFNAANKLIQRVSRREKKVYKPRPHMGAVRDIQESYNQPDIIFDDIGKKLKEGKTIMILASCSYMIDPIRKGLIERNLPFGNRYRVTRGDWNPLAKGGENRISARDLLYMYLSSGSDGKYWNVPQFVGWASHLGVGENGLKRNIGKKVLKKLKEEVTKGARGLESTKNVVSMCLEPAACEKAMARDVDWLMTNLLQRRKNAMAYPIRLYKKFQSKDFLEKPPPITIGTIHSVKGGEADVVYLYPDISVAAATERMIGAGQESEDSLLRLFYVGMTRAYEELVLMSPVLKRSGKNKVRVNFHMELS